MNTPHPTATKTFHKIEAHVYASLDDMALAAAIEAQTFLASTIDSKGSASVILATGNSQMSFLEKLHSLGGIDWEKVTLFHMDEYLGISDQHSASFRRYLRERVEQKLRPLAFHYIEGDALQPIDACEYYGSLLENEPPDLCCLGIGENGHLAFNDPPVADFSDPRKVKIVQLDEACRTQQVNEGHFPTLESVPPYAITLTIPALCQASKMLCIVPESRKAQAVKDALEGPVSTQCPGSHLRTQSHCTLFLDQDSARMVTW